MQVSKEEYAKKKISYGCSVQIENSVTRDNFGITRQASWCQTVTLETEFSIRTSQPLKILIIQDFGPLPWSTKLLTDHDVTWKLHCQPQQTIENNHSLFYHSLLFCAYVDHCFYVLFIGNSSHIFIPPANCVCASILFSRPSIYPSATFWFFIILKRQWRNFIKFDKHIDIHEMNIYDSKIRARGQFF